MATEVDELRSTLEDWRREARELTYEIEHALDIEWLNGRVSALAEVLAYIDGAPAGGAVRLRLLD